MTLTKMMDKLIASNTHIRKNAYFDASKFNYITMWIDRIVKFLKRLY